MLALSLFCAFRVSPAHSETADVMKAAERGLADLIGKLPAGSKELGGIPVDRPELCTVGKPFLVLTLNDRLYKGRYKSNSHTNPYFVNVESEWKVPVICKGGYISLLTVVMQNNEYSVTGIGDTALARELQQLSVAANDTDALFILRIHPPAADVFAFSKMGMAGSATYIPLRSAIAAMPGFKGQASYTLDETFGVIMGVLSQRAKD